LADLEWGEYWKPIGGQTPRGFTRVPIRGACSGVKFSTTAAVGSPSCLPVAPEYVVRVMVEIALLLQSFPQAEPSAVDPDLRSRHRTATDLCCLSSTQAFEVVEDESRPIVLGQASDHLPHAGVHLVDDETLVNCEVGIEQLGCFININNVNSVIGLPEMIGSNPCRYREGPRL